SMDHIGPMTRSAADAGIMLQVLAGYDPNDPTTLTVPAPNMLDGLDQGIQGVRIGLDERYITEGVDSPVTEGVLAGVRVLEELGAQVVPVQMPDTKEFLSAWGVLCQAEAAAAHRETYPARGDEYGPWFRGWLERGAAVTGAGYAEANKQRLACNGILAGVFDDIDVLVCPSMTTPAFPVTPAELYGPMGEDDWDWGRFTIPFDFNGAPTISLPCGQDGDGLPLSIQFVGQRLSEPLLCRMGHAFESATEWRHLHPDV
ncbi:MAG: amidase, partial [Dehalococcoidia bacterium]